jgi:hypothetical protein
VSYDKDGAPQTVRYHFVNAMLLNEVQRQRATIARQESRIQDLEARLSRLEAAWPGNVQAAPNTPTTGLRLGWATSGPWALDGMAWAGKPFAALLRSTGESQNDRVRRVP